MLTHSKLIRLIILVGPPVLAAILWLSSGRELFTKSSKIVEVTVTDELFGGANVEHRLVRGPLAGYYVGLDLVGGVSAVATLGWFIWWWVSRRARRLGPRTEKGDDMQSKHKRDHGPRAADSDGLVVRR